MGFFLKVMVFPMKFYDRSLGLPIVLAFCIDIEIRPLNLSSITISCTVRHCH